MSTWVFSLLEESRPVAGHESETGLRADWLWITWEHHRRTMELARALGVPLREVIGPGPRAVRYLVAGLATLAAIAKARPRIVFVQNPSIVLAALACALRRVLRYRVVVDRHSNFRFGNTETGLFNAVSNYSLRRADLTIVTNAHVKQLVEAKGGRGFVLQDRLPTLANARVSGLPGRVNVAFVCTYSPDEPVTEVIEAAHLLDGDVHIYITGRCDSLAASVRRSAPANVIFTDYLGAAEYESLLASVDFVMELTTRDHTLLCGAYEAVSLAKPLIVSRTEALTQYFCQGTVVTDNQAEAIAAAVNAAAADLPRLQREVVALREDLARDWASRFSALTQELERL
jgi:glycosyltransferase involved in cell wall biosynthesis